MSKPKDVTVNIQDQKLTGKLLSLEHSARTNTLKLQVNFSEELEVKIVELRNFIYSK